MSYRAYFIYYWLVYSRKDLLFSIVGRSSKWERVKHLHTKGSLKFLKWGEKKKHKNMMRLKTFFFFNAIVAMNR